MQTIEKFSQRRVSSMLGQSNSNPSPEFKSQLCAFGLQNASVQLLLQLGVLMFIRCLKHNVEAICRNGTKEPKPLTGCKKHDGGGPSVAL